MPLLLDLFSGIGGAGVGYNRAGFDVIGVDKQWMPEYPFAYYRQDAISFMRELLDSGMEIDGVKIDAIHASPPCKKFSTISKSLGYDSHIDLLTPIREQLIRSSLPYVIENVPGAPMRNPIMLCGSMFDLRIERGYLQRHRLFESNVMLQMPRPCDHTGQAIGVYGNGRGGGPLRMRTANAAEAKALMGIDWAGRNGITQAVPPAYTEYLGKQLLKRLQQTAQTLF